MPSVVFWYRIYCLCLAAVYLLLALSGGGLLVLGLSGEVNSSEVGNVIAMGALYGVMGCAFAVAYGIVPFVLPRTSWAWVVHLVLIGLTLTSCCCIPFAIPLIIYWFKAETKAYFNMAA